MSWEISDDGKFVVIYTNVFLNFQKVSKKNFIFTTGLSKIKLFAYIFSLSSAFTNIGCSCILILLGRLMLHSQILVLVFSVYTYLYYYFTTPCPDKDFFTSSQMIYHNFVFKIHS